MPNKCPSTMRISLHSAHAVTSWVRQDLRFLSDFAVLKTICCASESDSSGSSSSMKLSISDSSASSSYLCFSCRIPSQYTICDICIIAVRFGFGTEIKFENL
jgi:hypothetical protein